MDAPTLQRWLDEYVEAWRTYDSQKIGGLFSADAVYRFDPIEKDPLRGRDAIVESWLEEPDDPGGWDCEYRPLVVSGDVAIAEGWTRYLPQADKPGREYHNLFVMRFDVEGRCREFTEWYMQPKESRTASA